MLPTTLCWIALLLVISGASCFSGNFVLPDRNVSPVVIVGKIIIDEYGAPNDEKVDPFSVTVGGGGPQAAFGAAAALAVLSGDVSDPPMKQPVTLVGPVGKEDWTSREESALRDSLGGAIDSIKLLCKESLRTPRIQLWHDDDQNVQWRPLSDSFGPLGAENLWRTPTASEFLRAISPSEKVICYAIVEGGANSPGDGEDSLFLLDPKVQERIQYLGIEPVVFCNDDTGRVERRDVVSCTKRLNRIQSFDFLSPDIHLYREEYFWPQTRMEMAVRDGPNGSLLVNKEGEKTQIPAATLVTDNGEPINPTGAGNAFSAAFTICRGSGASIEDSACIATAIGGVFCEYKHMPPWNAAVLERIREAASEVGSKIAKARKHEYL